MDLKFVLEFLRGFRDGIIIGRGGSGGSSGGESGGKTESPNYARREMPFIPAATSVLYLGLH